MESYVKTKDPDVATATKAMRVLEQAYGTNHYLTRHSYHEVLHIQGRDKAREWQVPTYIAAGRLAHKQAKLDKKLSRQIDLLRQAKNHQEDINKDMDGMVATIGSINTDIRFLEDQRHDLLAEHGPNGTHGASSGTNTTAPPSDTKRMPTTGPPGNNTDATGNLNATRRRPAAESAAAPSSDDATDDHSGHRHHVTVSDLVARQARMVETSVWMSPATHAGASTASSDADQEAQGSGPKRKAANKGQKSRSNQGHMSDNDIGHTHGINLTTGQQPMATHTDDSVHQQPFCLPCEKPLHQHVYRPSRRHAHTTSTHMRTKGV
jgi:hypothetical protein